MSEPAAPSVDTIVAPAAEESVRRFSSQARPVLIKGALRDWPATSLWNADYLAERVGANPVPVAVMKAPGDYAGAERRKMPVRDYLAALSEGREDLYLGEVPLRQFLPELVADVERPDWFPDETPGLGVIYVGRNQFSQLHYHPMGSAVLCQVFGHKRVALYGPDQTACLYKYPWYSDNRNMSLTTSLSPDAGRFPRFAAARGTEVVVGPGDALFIPTYWWHGIQNRDLNAAVVFFWRRTLRSRWLPPPGMRAEYLLELGRAAVRRAARKVRGRRDAA